METKVSGSINNSQCAESKTAENFGFGACSADERASEADVVDVRLHGFVFRAMLLLVLSVAVARWQRRHSPHGISQQ